MRDMKESKIMWKVYHSLLWNLSLWSDDYHHLLQCFGNGACGNRFWQLKRKTERKRKEKKDPTFINKNKEVGSDSNGIVKDRLLFETQNGMFLIHISIERSFISLPAKVIDKLCLPTAFWKHLGLLFHEINTKYTGTEVKIIRQPYPGKIRNLFALNILQVQKRKGLN